LSHAQNKTIRNVLILYLTSTILLVATFAYSYYIYQKTEQENKIKVAMEKKAKGIVSKLQTLHNSLSKNMQYPRFEDFQSAIYDRDKNLIFSTLENKQIDLNQNFYTKNGFTYFVYEMVPYYMGTHFVVVEQKTENTSDFMARNIIVLAFLIILIVLFTSLFLVKLLLKPLKESVDLLDRFIKDTTHELNTPIATILTNIELLENVQVDTKILKKINRIKTASLTISNIYEDLAFLILNHSLSSQNELLNVNELIQQRVEYFAILFKSKNLTVNIKEQNILSVTMDKKKLIRVIDNLISNSIKYTKKETHIEINIGEKFFCICDEGYGMTQEQINRVFERYTRFNTTQGGFGIGYNIIYTIANEYNIDIKIDSSINEGTCVTLTF